MKKTKMLKKNYEFRKVLTKGNYFAGDCIQIVVLKSNGNRFYKNYNYIGIAVNTKFGKAVKRNKIKRLIRENYKILEDRLDSGYSLVFLLRKNVEIESLTFKNISQDMEKLLKKSKIMIK